MNEKIHAPAAQLVIPFAEIDLRGSGPRAGARAARPAPALPSQRVTSATTEISGPIQFFSLDPSWHWRLSRATKPEDRAALYAEREARRRCITDGYCVAYFTQDREFFTWHFYPSKAALLAHVEYLNFAFRFHGGCPPVAKMRLLGRLWTAAEKLAFERRAHGI